MDRAANDHATDPEQVRSHLARPRLERPMSSVEHASAASAPRTEPPRSSVPPQSSVPSRISVMEWLLAVGHAVASRLKGAPPSAMAQLHPPD